MIIIIILFLSIMEFGSEAKYGYTMANKERDIYLSPVADHKYTLVWMHGLGDSA